LCQPCYPTVPPVAGTRAFAQEATVRVRLAVLLPGSEARWRAKGALGSLTAVAYRLAKAGGEAGALAWPGA
jgi:hypothetical protein